MLINILQWGSIALAMYVAFRGNFFKGVLLFWLLAVIWSFVVANIHHDSGPFGVMVAAMLGWLIGLVFCLPAYYAGKLLKLYSDKRKRNMSS